jgi:predicted DNA-binding transcriptional regulator YafY
MREQIISAIEKRNVISFLYEDETRIVEPFTLGFHKETDNLILSAWWIEGYSESNNRPPWRLYKVEKMSNLKILEEKAATYRVGYNSRDSRMSRILCTV